MKILLGKEKYSDFENLWNNQKLLYENAVDVYTYAHILDYKVKTFV